MDISLLSDAGLGLMGFDIQRQIVAKQAEIQKNNQELNQLNGYLQNFNQELVIRKQAKEKQEQEAAAQPVVA